ncbi:hypothetical protein B0H15DRAFT_838526 [Mycena belliarum]|uniref:Uncharacterized protein n=1 Tax=Mycena belliarum TaxID=1033014 RepID=A0AAD6U5B3_9AGAR|nr:hypothetical protein B0H15DRAFT_838526 [Mycena belliae]
MSRQVVRVSLSLYVVCICHAVSSFLTLASAGIRDGRAPMRSNATWDWATFRIIYLCSIGTGLALPGCYIVLRSSVVRMVSALHSCLRIWQALALQPRVMVGILLTSECRWPTKNDDGRSQLVTNDRRLDSWNVGGRYTGAFVFFSCTCSF